MFVLFRKNGLHNYAIAKYTQVKTHKLLQVCKQVVTNLFTSCQQVVFALLVPRLLEQVWNKLLTTCKKLDGIIRLVTNLFWQVWYSHDITRMLQGWWHKVVTILLYHDCIRLYRTCWNNLATNLILSTRLLQVVNSLSKLVDNLGQAVRRQLVDGLLTNLLHVQNDNCCLVKQSRARECLARAFVVISKFGMTIPPNFITLLLAVIMS